MRILITGGDGEFCKHLVKEGKECTFLTPTKKEADIRHYWNLDSYFYSHLKLGPSASEEESKDSQLYIHSSLLKETNKITLLSKEKF